MAYDPAVTSAPTSSPLQPTKAERRSLLSRHFIQVIEPLLEAGELYAEISVVRLIKEAKIARSTFYLYFVDKSDLLVAMAEDIQAELVQAGQRWWTFPPDGNRADLRAALLPSITVHRAHYKIMGALAEAASYDENVRKRYLELMVWIISNLEIHIRQAQEQGVAAPDLEPRTTAEWLIAMHERGLYQFVGPADDERAERLVDSLTDIVWRTLYQGFRT